MEVHRLFPKLLGLQEAKRSIKYNFFCAKTVGTKFGGNKYSGTESLDF
jgi:hypothetical protein